MAATSAPKGHKRLGDLPHEILIQILGLLTSRRDLCSVCLVSRAINAVADPVLYKAIFFDQPKHHMTFSESLLTRPRRGSLIQNIRLEYPSAELYDILSLKDGPARLDNFSHAISTMSNLETLVISVPEALCRGIGTLFNGPFDLACLKSCDIFYHREDGGYWDLQENIHIFSHPALSNLTIRHAKLDKRGFESLEQPSATPLKQLHLIECDINDDALSDILLLPEELKEITMTQLEIPYPPLEESADDIEDYILAMRSAQHSLETIAIDFPTLGSENPLKMRDFQALTSLELRDYQLFGQASPRMHAVGLPPNLATLELLNRVGEDEDLAELLCYTIERKDSMLLARHLKRLVVGEGPGGLPPKLIEACTTCNVQLDVVYMTAD